MNFPQTEQECFDQIVNHLRAQGCKSYTPYPDAKEGIYCFYKIESGGRTLKCAAGCLIPDEIYSPLMETKRIEAVIRDVPKLTPLKKFQHIIGKLQTIHDRVPVENWEQNFKDTAAEYGLTYSPIVQLGSL